MQGIDFILGNDLAGGKVLPLPEVIDNPAVPPSSVVPGYESVFPACAVTRAQARRQSTDELCDTFMAVSDPLVSRAAPSDGGVVEGAPRTRAVNVHGDETMSLPVSKTLISQEQRKDSTLTQCRSAVVDKANITANSVAFFWDKGILMRKWNPPTADDVGWNSVYQVVVPLKFRSQVLCLGHDNVMSGHLGVTKTYNRILRHFFWPGLKSDVAQYCRSCHVCQLAGKTNQSIPPAPLCPVPVLTEPFSKIILDCVGPLPRTKTGFKYLLTIMCSATRFPEAVPLRSLKAKNIVRALVTFFSTFGLPKLVQTDQGSNFLSRLFKQVLEELQIKHLVSSAYHPQSQGALERFHQTLKSMLRTYCLASAKEWDEGLPLLLFAIRETVQESLGFSPADLVFGHTVRGPLKLLKEAWVAEPLTETNMLDHVSSFRERLHNACATARASLQHAQGSMKARYDQKAVSRSFQPGDRVLVLLPLMGSALQAKFSGPYVVESQLSDTDYVVRTPDRKRKMRVCHVNMLKKYVMRDSDATQDNVDPPGKGAAVLSVASMPLLDAYSPEEDGLHLGNVPVSSPRLHNSVILQNLDAHLSHLPLNEREQVMILIRTYKTLFGDVPSCTTVLKHDIDVGEHAPIRQHPYRLNPTKRTVMQSEVDYLLEHGFSVPSCSPWSSPCLLVPKPDGTVRFCTDYRKVNAVTRPDSFPLPRMEDCVDRVGSARIVSKLDLLRGYWQVPLTPRASEISAFVTPDNFLEYTVMPFGLRNAPATFQRLMAKVLCGIKNCDAYLDDIIVYSSTWSEHIHTLTAVFKRLQDASLTLNLAKCEFGKATVTYLGKEVGQGQVKPVMAKIQAILAFPVPTSKRELRRFLGMAGYYRAFCKNFSEVVCPLTELLRGRVQFSWNDECQNAFMSVKTLLCSTPVLAAPDFQRPFKLEVDASAVGAGAVLLQEDADGVDHPICFSKKFLKHQVNYSTIEKEALALILALQHFEVYIGSTAQPVFVFTDHNPLVFLSRMKNTNQRIMRWSLVLHGFNLEIKYKRGTDNVLADALSRAF
uniref:Gypsy retrotransposon integrase-like protein 1 n=1 Tax=Denticeps clupeoides TaxID=299321 RepID=A0AAY4AYL3_9TELE